MQSALAAALAAELGDGWTLDETNYTVKNSLGLGFKFLVNSSSVYIGIVNNTTSYGNYSNTYISPTSAAILDVCKGKSGGIAVGIRANGAGFKINAAVGEKADGETVAVYVYPGSKIYFLHETSGAATEFSFFTLTGSGIATSLFPLPDFKFGGLFKDLFCLPSCSATSTNLEFAFGGRNFVQLKAYSGSNAATALVIEI